MNAPQTSATAVAAPSTLEAPENPSTTSPAVSRPHPKLVIERHDSGTPRCECGCFQTWVDEFRDWLCPHCDGINGIDLHHEDTSSKRGDASQ